MPAAKPQPKKRCTWARNDLAIAYHDDEWGVPLHHDRLLFEFLILGGAQAGLSWDTILKKRPNYRRAYDRFDPRKVARYDARRRKRLLADAGIVRNRLKVEASVQNAQAFLEVQQELGNFDHYVWSFVNGRPRQNHFKTLEDIPVSTDESGAMSKDLKRRGFRFVGPTICYAFMQATGMVNDHLTTCFRHRELK